MPGTLSHLTVLATIAIATVPSPGIIAQAPREAIVGQWKGAIDEGGSRTEVIIEFFPNGTYARRVALTSQFGWTLSGDVLLLAPALSKSNDEISYGKASAVHMKLKDSVLVISDAEACHRSHQRGVNSGTLGRSLRAERRNHAGFPL